MSATIQFDADIYNAVFIGHVYFYDEPKKQYECSLRMLELFVRVENILPPYPRFLVMIVCFVVSQCRPRGVLLARKHCDAILPPRRL
jgi:hypothetical protein